MSVSLWGPRLNGLAQVWPHNIMPCHHFAGSALELYSDEPDDGRLAFKDCVALLRRLHPLAPSDSVLAIKMLKSFQKLDFTNGKTASAFLRLHIWQP